MLPPLCFYQQVYFLGGLTLSHVRSGFWVGGSGESPFSIVTWRGLSTCPPFGPRSMYSPDRLGFSPGFCLSFGIVTSLR